MSTCYAAAYSPARIQQRALPVWPALGQRSVKPPHVIRLAFPCTTGILWSLWRARRRAAEDLYLLLEALELCLGLAISQAQEEQGCLAEVVLSVGIIVVTVSRLGRWVGKERGNELKV